MRNAVTDSKPIGCNDQKDGRSRGTNKLFRR